MLIKKPLQLVLFFVLVACSTSEVAAQGFGAAVAVGDGEVLISEPFTTRTSGAVYVYAPDADGNWTERIRLVSSETRPADGFGRTIALDGSTLVVGTTVPDSGRGAAFVFERPVGGEWAEVARLQPLGVAPNEEFGRSAAVAGDFIAVATIRQNERAGAVYVFRRDPASGAWSEHQKLTGTGIEKNSVFGLSLAMEGDLLLVGAPNHARRRGALFVFRRNPATNMWAEEAVLGLDDAKAGEGLGTAVLLMDGIAYAGAPRRGRSAGAVFRFVRNEGGAQWELSGEIHPPDSTQGRFGNAIATDGSSLWVGAPRAAKATGAIYRFEPDPSTGEWAPMAPMSFEGLEEGDQFATSLAAGRGVAVAGVAGDDYGAGTAMILVADGAGGWRSSGTVFATPDPLMAVLGGEVPCSDNSADQFGCGEVDLVAFLPNDQIGAARGVRLNDVWGWTDPLTGKDYAIVGRADGTSFVDISDPLVPVYVGDLPMHEGSQPNKWRDMKVYSDHVFIVADGAGKHGMQVFDLTQLRDVTSPPITFTETTHYDQVASVHNIVINEETGFAYAVGTSSGGETCGGGLHMIDIRDPGNPIFAGCFADPATGRRKTGYSHDAQCVLYHGPDAEHEGREICFGSNETALSIADVTDKANPVPISVADYPNVGYAHQGWLTDDHRFFFLDDELDEVNGLVENTRTMVWDVTDLDDPILIAEYFGPTRATDHNLYVKGDRMYQSNNRSGLRVIDVSDPANPAEVGHFDTTPWSRDEAGFDGTWSVYPFFESGVVLLSSRLEGLFLVRPRPRLVP